MIIFTQLPCLMDVIYFFIIIFIFIIIILILKHAIVLLAHFVFFQSKVQPRGHAASQARAFLIY